MKPKNESKIFLSRNMATIFDPFLIKKGKDVTSDSVIPPASRVVLEGCLKILHILLRVFDSFFSLTDSEIMKKNINPQAVGICNFK